MGLRLVREPDNPDPTEIEVSRSLLSVHICGPSHHSFSDLYVHFKRGQWREVGSIEGVQAIRRHFGSTIPAHQLAVEIQAHFRDAVVSRHVKGTCD